MNAMEGPDGVQHNCSEYGIMSHREKQDLAQIPQPAFSVQDELMIYKYLLLLRLSVAVRGLRQNPVVFQVPARGLKTTFDPPKSGSFHRQGQAGHPGVKEQLSCGEGKLQNTQKNTNKQL